MRIDEELARASPPKDTLLTVGVFDGVHLGHRHLFSRLKREARERGLSSGAVTFINHPMKVLYPERPISYLSTSEERVRLIGELGLELVVPITFDLELSTLTARQYLERLQKHLRMRGLVVGPDFALGHQREGDTRVLAALGQEMGFSIEVVDPLYLGEIPVRSTVIREALSWGDIGKATKLLGGNFSLSGEVAVGFGRGKGLGFPTANLQVAPERLLPGDGIYATWAHLDDERYMAATSIGTRPTFGPGERTVEAFLLDFQGDLYGREMGLEFVQRIRDEVSFESPEALQRQIAQDVAATREILGSVQPIGSQP